MNNNNNISKRETGFNFDYSEASMADTNQLLSEGSMARKNSMHGKENPSDASTALEALNNIFKAFNTVTEMGNCQSADGVPDNPSQKEYGDITNNMAVNSGNDNGTPESSGSVPSQDNTPVDVVEKSYADNKEAESPMEPEKEQKDKTAPITHKTDKGSADSSSSNLSAEIQRKLRFFPVFDGDEKRVEDIRRTKEIVSSFDSYEEMLKAINDIADEGSEVDSEVFFLLHNVYTLAKPEKYYHYFRSNLFSKEYLSSGKGEEIDYILEKMTQKNTI